MSNSGATRSYASFYGVVQACRPAIRLLRDGVARVTPAFVGCSCGIIAARLNQVFHRSEHRQTLWPLLFMNDNPFRVSRRL